MCSPLVMAVELFFFFFQAEDGIRDWSVTGVQTCALPIFLIQRISAQARESKVNYSGINVMKNASKPNEFFEEQTLHLGVNPTGDKELVDFLVAIGNSDLMVRVKELNLNPDQGGYKLMGSMNLVASFQKKSPIGSATVRPAGALSSTKP